ncbi:MAG: hypothetical protein IJ395_02650 [Clostridia bacterium]|nr:hypothetical protein [Clostridia bacterium]
MANEKHSDTKRFFLGVAITIAVWALGIFSAGRIPFLVDYVYVPGGNETLSLLFPFFLLVYSSAFAVFCKRKSGDAVFFGAYLFLIVPSVSFLLLQINQFFLGLERYVSLILLLLLIPAMPVLSAFDAYFAAFYGSVRPVGFTAAHIIFCIVLIVASALPPIIYKLVKRK